ncbi:MAG: ArsR family transcriptional regulator [Bacteroidetes bacterium]|nr:ArsR family transcriptional regulator [Bacteroidota bacterium]
MIQTLISSKTRIKLLLKFFLDGETRSYLRHLETEFGESTNAIRLELNKFEKAGMLISEHEGNRKYFKANDQHPLFQDVKSIVRKYIGIDWIVEYVAKRLGELKQVYLTGSIANGIDSQIIELIFIGEINEEFLHELCQKVEKQIQRKIQYKVLINTQSFDKLFEESDAKFILLWEKT